MEWDLDGIVDVCMNAYIDNLVLILHVCVGVFMQQSLQSLSEVPSQMHVLL